MENLSSDQQNEDKMTSDQTKLEEVPALSKRKMKRLLREQRWQEQRPERKRREKEKRLAKRRFQKLNTDQETITEKSKKIHPVPMNRSSCKVNIVIDCDYENYMNEQEMRKLCKQINRCYAINRHSPAPCQLWFTSIQPGRGQLGQLLERLQPGYPNWDVHRSEKHWSEIFPPDLNVIYLSGDSPETIPDCAAIQQQSIEQVFIIGGLIDHNRYKGLALKRAEEYKVKHGQLPIGEYIRMSQRRILSIPHVFEIMLLAANGQSGPHWTEIFQQVIPNRKLCKDDK